MDERLTSLLLAAPAGRPVAAVRSRGLALVAVPEATFRVTSSGAGTPRSAWIVRGGEAAPPVPFTHAPLADLAAVLAWGAETGRAFGGGAPAGGGRGGEGGAFAGGWIGAFSYDLGRVIEPAVERGGGPRAVPDRAWPLIELHWCPRALAVGPGGEVRTVGDAGAGPLRDFDGPHAPDTFDVSPLSSGTGRAAYENAAAAAVEHIRAGDAFQVNLAHRLSGPFGGSARALFAALCRGATPWHGAYVEVAPLAGGPHGPRPAPLAMASASPELFLRLEPLPGGGTRITTRPMKGTRPASADPRELEASAKDRAELNMITDLMRNDLGRAARPGTVRVEQERRIERHGGHAGGVLQAVATVSAEAPPGVGLADVLRAAFPAGSVTGAPKVRAMQIIDTLEPVRRGPYCGSLGWISDTGHAELNVAIRTALISGPAGGGERGGAAAVRDGLLDYSVGAGIVAESDPGCEWRETLDKAAILGGVTRGVPAPV